MSQNNDFTRFSDRIFCNHEFVHKQLFDSQYIRKLMFVHKYVKPSLLFSDVVKKSKQMVKNDTMIRWLGVPPVCSNRTVKPILLEAKYQTKLVFHSLTKPLKNVYGNIYILFKTNIFL